MPTAMLNFSCYLLHVYQTRSHLAVWTGNCCCSPHQSHFPKREKGKQALMDNVTIWEQAVDALFRVLGCFHALTMTLLMQQYILVPQPRNVSSIWPTLSVHHGYKGLTPLLPGGLAACCTLAHKDIHLHTHFSEDWMRNQVRRALMGTKADTETTVCE